jgi:hypothetical protein
MAYDSPLGMASPNAAQCGRSQRSTKSVIRRVECHLTSPTRVYVFYLFSSLRNSTRPPLLYFPQPNSPAVRELPVATVKKMANLKAFMLVLIPQFVNERQRPYPNPTQDYALFYPIFDNW